MQCGSSNDFWATLPKSFGPKRGKPRKSSNISNSELQEILQIFNKMFSFQKTNGEWELPDVNAMFRNKFWEFSELQTLKEELNAVKSKLNNYNLEDWHKHTRVMNKAGDILWRLKNIYEPEFVTQAWCKFYECVMTFPLVPPKVTSRQMLCSVHLCEAPGAFITSLNHYLKLHYPGVQWLWRASTLNPYYEGNPLSSMINDDRFIFQTLPNWMFGQDFTGNIMNMDNIQHLIKETKNMGEVLLVTADGSVDCHSSPAEQEQLVSQLHYYETAAALHILAEGGSFLLKIFTTYEAQTISLLYFLCCSFHQVNLFKPATSKEGNSEVYVVCLEYKGRSHILPWLEKMTSCLDFEFTNNVMFPLETVPEDFIEQLLSCSCMFKEVQVEVIENNIRMYGATPSQDNHTKRIKYLTAQHFMEHYKLEKLSDDSKELVGKAKLNETTALNLDPHMEKGSFNEQFQKKHASLKNKLMSLHEDLLGTSECYEFTSNIQWFEFQSSVMELSVITGKAVNTIYCSKFCSRHILKLWNYVREVTTHILKESYTDKNTNSEFPTEICTESIREVLSAHDFNLHTNIKILNFKSAYWVSLNDNKNEQVEKRAYKTILATVTGMQTGENLLLESYPMLSQFNVGVVYLLSNLFEKVGFIKPVNRDFGVIFVGFQSSNKRVFEFLKEIGETCTELEREGQGRSVLAVVDVRDLCGRFGTSQYIDNSSSEPQRKRSRKNGIELLDTGQSFYPCVTEINNMYIKEQVSQTIDGVIWDE